MGNLLGTFSGNEISHQRGYVAKEKLWQFSHNVEYPYAFVNNFWCSEHRNGAIFAKKMLASDRRLL